MRLLVIGQSGQVARELAKLELDAVFLSRRELDLTDKSQIKGTILRQNADAVINAAAYTNVDGAEEDRMTAKAVNADAPGEIAKACAMKGTPLVQISTDYVFDGSGEDPWMPGDKPGPLGVYGETKLVGERLVAAGGCPFAVLRTSWVFSEHGKNFVTTMLRLAEQKSELSIVSDQIGGPTSAASIAEACVKIATELKADRGKSGIYHYSGASDVSWADFARAIFELAGKDVKVSDILTAQYPTPARRPKNSRLDCSAIEHAFKIKRPDWKKDLSAVLESMKVST